MASTITYVPPTHCAVCISTGKHTVSTTRVGDYLACDAHAAGIEARGLAGAIKHAKRGKA